MWGVPSPRRLSANLCSLAKSVSPLAKNEEGAFFFACHFLGSTQNLHTFIGYFGSHLRLFMKFLLVTFRRANFQGVNLLAKFVKKEKIKGRCQRIETLTPPE